MTRPPAHPARVAGLLCALALGAACAGCSGDPQAPATGLTPLGDANPAMKTERPEAPAGLAVTGVRTGHHDTFDRVVFDLAGEGRPGWYVDYDETPRQPGLRDDRHLPGLGGAQRQHRRHRLPL